VEGLQGARKLAIWADLMYLYKPMETKVVKLDPANIDRTRIKEAAALVDDGALVAFPTETVYGIACRAKCDSLIRLDDLKGRTAEKHFTLHIGRSDDVRKYVPTIGLKAQKLIRNTWPGPLTIVFELNANDMDIQRKGFGQDVFDRLYKQNSIGIRCPDHAVAAGLLEQTSNPVVAPSANLTGEQPALDGAQVLAQLSGRIEMLLDAGPSKYGRGSTVVKVGKKGLTVLRDGVYSQEDLEALSRIKFLFVCTGNTCRSPMAEGMFRKYLAEKAQCNIDDLEKNGYTVDSAGIIGSSGFPASPEAVAACAAKGIDISAHRNKGLSRELVEESDFIFAMEQVHRQRVVALEPRAEAKCFLLAGSKGVPDPIGHSQEFYNYCANVIEKAVQERIGELVI
jgi:L-threonylcarbamoyladenylate synthase